MAKKKVRLDQDDLDEELDADAGSGSADLDDDDEPAPEAPKGRNTGLTLVLCLLNVAAALGFMYLMVMTFSKRQAWSYAVFMYDLHLQGLPLKEEDEGTTASRATLPRMRLEPDALKDVFQKRGGSFGAGAKEFWAVSDEAFPHRIMAQHLTDEIVKDYFSGLGEEVKTLEAEIVRLKQRVPKDILEAARGILNGPAPINEDAKRKLARKMLLTLAKDIHEIESLEKKISVTKGLELDALLEDAVQRRMLMDILAPCDIFRPADTNFGLEQIGDSSKVKLDKLHEILQKRFDNAIAPKYDGDVHFSKEHWDTESRWSIEKRQTIGFLLVAIGSVRKPHPKALDTLTPLYPEGSTGGAATLTRASTVLGLYEFSAAAQNLPIAWNRLEERMVRAIAVDRSGFDIPAKNEHSDGFVDRHDAWVKRLQDLVVANRNAEERLKDLQAQAKLAQKTLDERIAHRDEMIAKFKAARAQTAKQVAELRELQKQLFEAQAELRDAGERNFLIELEIRREERKAQDLLRGIKTP